MSPLLNLNQSACLRYWLICLWMFSAPVWAQSYGSVVRIDPQLDTLVAADAKIDLVVQGFRFVEGPVWLKSRGYLVFSDIPGNRLFKWNPRDLRATVILEASGFTGKDATGVSREVNEGGEVFYNLGSNGVTVDEQGRLVFIAMGDRQIVRLETDGKRTVLASQYQGKRLNSGNDLVYRRNGMLYFTDPPSGLRGGDEDLDKQMDFNGVFLLKDGILQLLTREIFHPNGIALSPDETMLYANDNRTRQITRYDVLADGTITNPHIFADMTADKSEGNPDGMKVDLAGNMYAAGAGGIWILSPAGKLLGKIVLPERASNMAFGDDDGKTLYVTARTSIYKIRLLQAGPLP